MNGKEGIGAAVAAGVLAGALVVLGTTLVPADPPRPQPTVTETAVATVHHIRPAKPAPAVTVTVTARPSAQATERASRSRQAAQAAPAGFEAWLASPTGQRISWRESRNRCDITNPTGKYQGKWQFDTATWLSNGGGKYAPHAHLATCHEQDLIAYATWQRRGWQPWGE